MHADDLRSMGLRIKQAREDKHLTRESLAEIVELTPHYIYEIEMGLKKMSITVFDSLVRNLEVSPSYLLLGEKRIFDERLLVLMRNLPQYKEDALINIISTIIPYITDENNEQ